MSNKYSDLVKIIQKSRENIKPALQGNIFEREMLGRQVLSGEEAKIKALEEIKQRPQVKIVDEEIKTPIVADDEVKEEEVKEEEVKEEVKEEEFTDEELADKLENHSLDLSKIKIRHKNSFKSLKQAGRGKKYFIIGTDSKGNDQIAIYTKGSKIGTPAEPNGIDELLLTLPLIKGRIPFDVGLKNLKLFTSLLRKGDDREMIKRQIGDYFKKKPVKVGKGLEIAYKPSGNSMNSIQNDPRLLLGAYLAKNNNKQLENLIMNKIYKHSMFN